MRKSVISCPCLYSGSRAFGAVGALSEESGINIVPDPSGVNRACLEA